MEQMDFRDTLEAANTPALKESLQAIMRAKIEEQYDILKNLRHSEQIIITLIFLCLIFVCKFFFLIFVNYYQFKFSMNLQSEISKKLIQNYIKTI